MVVCTGSVQRHRETFSYSHTEMLFTFRPSLTKTELSCLLCGSSATSVIPGIFGIAWSLALLGLCIAWSLALLGLWHCLVFGSVCFLETYTVVMLYLHNSDSMDALLADRPSTFADITSIAPEGP